MVLKLDKVSRGPHLPALVASSISREIAQGRLKPGDKLPTEQELSQTFGVSRNVVREAISRLRSEGRVWSQQGRGAFVSEASDSTVLTIDSASLQQADAFRGLFELRGILEAQAAALAAARRTGQDLELMRQTLATMCEAPYGSVTWLKTDLEFHRVIAAATRNSYMVQFLVFISERIRESILAAGHRLRSDDMAQTTLAEHQRILDAIAAGDDGEARRAMQSHIEAATRRVGLPVEPAPGGRTSPPPPLPEEQDR
ncbi:FadR/GntR family transcriptional regulator [Labrys monachus]|uniref:DNA-binding FadR family transcriptional regulator n=1 Tax=Labrys monachus TaxID=217067 RepID=A0ABU0FB09_9HYPH|nr:FadR/GntR family transcriptional regulator [Labrys monachus]MDQ0391517.1 DNA-binding FadR family transcriptional regulator [Labrys monachus]